MNIYNLRIGDLLYQKSPEGYPISAVVYKLTPRYVYYAVCASNRDGEGKAYVTKGHKVKKEQVFKSLYKSDLKISYAAGVKRRRKVENIFLE